MCLKGKSVMIVVKPEKKTFIPDTSKFRIIKKPSKKPEREKVTA